MQIGTREYDAAHTGIAADHQFDKHVFVVEPEPHIRARLRSSVGPKAAKQEYTAANRRSPDANPPAKSRIICCPRVRFVAYAECFWHHHPAICVRCQ